MNTLNRLAAKANQPMERPMGLVEDQKEPFWEAVGDSGKSWKINHNGPGVILACFEILDTARVLRYYSGSI